MELFNEEFPFVYDSELDRVVYSEKIIRKEKLVHDGSKPYVKMQKKYDAIKIASCMANWTTSTSQIDLYPFDADQLAQLSDRIDFIFNPIRWKSFPTVYVGIYNSQSVQEPVDFTIRLREYMPQDTYSENVKAYRTMFESSLDGTDAHAVSF